MNAFQFLKGCQNICRNSFYCGEGCLLEEYCPSAFSENISMFSDEKLQKLIDLVSSQVKTREQKAKELLNIDDSIKLSGNINPCDYNRNYLTKECENKTVEKCLECSKKYWNEIIFD